MFVLPFRKINAKTFKPDEIQSKKTFFQKSERKFFTHIDNFIKLFYKVWTKLFLPLQNQHHG